MDCRLETWCWNDRNNPTWLAGHEYKKQLLILASYMLCTNFCCSLSPVFIKTTKCCLQSFSLNFFLVAVLCCAPVGCGCLCLGGAWQRHCSNLVAGRRAKWETLGHDASYRGPPWSLLRAYSVGICVNWRSPADQCNLMIAEETCPHLASRQQSSYASKHGKEVISCIK